MKIPKRIASAVINSLKGGVVPRIGLPYITVGRDSHAKFCVRSQLYHIASEKKSFFLISAPLTVENCRVWYSLWIF